MEYGVTGSTFPFGGKSLRFDSLYSNYVLCVGFFHDLVVIKLLSVLWLPPEHEVKLF